MILRGVILRAHKRSKEAMEEVQAHKRLIPYQEMQMELFKKQIGLARVLDSAGTEIGESVLNLMTNK